MLNISTLLVIKKQGQRKIPLHTSKDLVFTSFDSDQNPLRNLPQVKQVQYLDVYLSELKASVVIEESNYFDRDYLDEFSAFYSLSSHGYPNICRRLHFFSSDEVNRDLLLKAASEDVDASKIIKETYLGFTVIRPIPSAPLGRTVLKWFPDNVPEMPRITHPSRTYRCHLAGVTLEVIGLAWQQQDRGVGACATVGLWVALHSSAFDDHHAVPTTAEITKAAHDGAALGTRMFPSHGLNMHQVMEAIKAQQLAPIWIAGDMQYVSSNSQLIAGFSKERFASTCASFLRSGYPVLIWGQHLDENAVQKHIVCAVGFRESPPAELESGNVGLQDSETLFLYVHDDNLGPSVRFRIIDNDCDEKGNAIPVTIQTDPPNTETDKSPTADYPVIRPEALCIAVHECLRISPDNLHIIGKTISQQLCNTLNIILEANGHEKISVSSSSRFIKLADYIGFELGRTLANQDEVLGKTRMALTEKVPPMSLHTGVVRFALSNSTPIMDLLYDTTDTDINCPVFAHVVYDETVATNIMSQSIGMGELVEAFV